MIDWVQVTAVLLEIGAVVCLGVYYGMFGKPLRLYVSDLLFTMVSYQAIVSTFISIQTVLCYMFVYRLYKNNPRQCIVAAIAIFVSIVGWITLNIEYKAPDGSTSSVHIWGTLVFISGVVVYFTCLMTCIWAYIYNAGSKLVHTFLAGGIVFLYLASIVFVFIFGWKFTHNESEGWIYEHAALITVVIAHVFLFAIESPNPRHAFPEVKTKEKIKANPTELQFLIPHHMR